LTLRNTGGLWAITAFLTPAGYTRRLKNYRLFRRHLSVPLITVELSFNRRFELATGDSEILVQLHGGDVMWQKERLLNLALQHLPSACDTVAWRLRCHLGQRRLGRPGPACARQRCARPAVRETARPCPRRGPGHFGASWDAEPTAFSVAHRLATGHVGLEAFRGNELIIRFSCCIGLAWAIRREVLDVHGCTTGPSWDQETRRPSLPLSGCRRRRPLRSR
jgi:hypothetical protein